MDHVRLDARVAYQFQGIAARRTALGVMVDGDVSHGRFCVSDEAVSVVRTSSWNY